MKALVVGVGSAGMRHMRNLISLGVEVSAFRYRGELASNLRSELAITVHPSLQEAFDASPDAVVIANRPDQHIQVACEAVNRGAHIYVEKPLSHNLAQLDELAAGAAKKSLVVETGCMLRSDPNLRAIRELLFTGTIGPILFVQSSVGQYLPHWRPGDYRDNYSAKAKQGGGVLLDLVHDLDYLVWWFGPITKVTATLAKLSDLEISSEDVAEVTVHFKNGGLGQVHMDYLRPSYQRKCQIIAREGLITWSDLERTVVLERLGDNKTSELGVGGYDRNDLFLDHMRHFLESIESGASTTVPLNDAIHVMRVVSAAKKSSRNQRAVTV